MRKKDIDLLSKQMESTSFSNFPSKWNKTTGHVQIEKDYESIAENWKKHSDKLSKLFVLEVPHQPVIRKQNQGAVQKKTSTMLFICSVIFIVSWIPFWIDVFNLTSSLTFRYLFFIGHATNPIVYGIVNNEIRKGILQLFRCSKKW